MKIRCTWRPPQERSSGHGRLRGDRRAARPWRLKALRARHWCWRPRPWGWGTCWLGAGFYPDIINRNVDLQTDERVYCVISIGKRRPRLRPSASEWQVCGMDAQLGRSACRRKRARRARAQRDQPAAVEDHAVIKTSVSILKRPCL